jgi:large subunit ribosomal protein L32
MAVPKKQTSRTKRNMRRAHDALSPVPSVKTATGIRLSHRVDPATGQYRGRQVTTPKVKSA